MTYRPKYKVTDGSDLILDGHTWRVEVKDRDGYLVSGADGEQTTLGYQRVDRAIENNKCEVITPKEAENQRQLLEFTGGFGNIDQTPDIEQRNARARQALIMAMDRLEKEGQKLTHRYLDRVPVRKALYRSAIEISGDVSLFADVNIGPTRRSGDEPETVVPKGRTLAKLRELYIRFNRNPVVLINRHNKKGVHDPERACKLSEWQKSVVRYILGAFQSPSKIDLARLYRLACAKLQVPEEEAVRNVGHPSITTVRNWLAGVPSLAQQIGRNGLRHTKNTAGGGATEIRAFMFGERAAMDQAYLSIFVDTTGKIKAKIIKAEDASKAFEEGELIRIWLHVMIDVATRLPLGWIISETAHSDQSMALLRMATRDKSREVVKYKCRQEAAPPAGLLMTVADNGSATRNGPVYAAQMGMGTVAQLGRTHHSNDNTHIERLIGSIEWDVLRFEKGYVGGRPGALPGADPVADARLTPNDVMAVITRYLVDEYAHTEHRGTGMFKATPWEKFEQTIEDYGPIEPPSPEARRLYLGYKKTVSTTSEGVLFSHLPYNSHELLKFHDDTPKKVNVYLDPDFIDEVTVQPVRGKKIIKAELSMTALKDLTFEEAAKVMSDAAQGNPDRRRINDEMVRQARRDRVDLSGMLPDPNLPESYRTLAQLEKKAEALTHVGFEPDRSYSKAVAPGTITKRRKPKPFAIERTEAHKDRTDPGVSGRLKPITESKL
ncbi:hypothetical protein [Tateyamaria omphalii]|uniref:Integrase catalytic domain-containing protein n=1 Tax=Tateyamaria omphalii TaxID=299262 RepID=A0A1P8MQD8_9RHOB|nr:hypothetical protein [Tateyamaria omphalii]APX10286.1 hypothetical protein BWR18_00150 [Tateyamaria omphalii]